MGRLIAVLGEERVEAPNGALDQVEEFIRQWSEVFTLDQPRFVERYQEGKGHLVVTFKWVNRPEQYAAVFHAWLGALETGWNLERELFPRSTFVSRHRAGSNTGSHSAQVDVCHCCGCGQEELVLVSDVQSMEDPEVVIPSLVWLQPLDRFYRGLSRTLYLSMNGSFELAGLIDDGKTVPALDIGSVMADKIAHQDVERRSQIVNEVTEDARDFVGDGSQYAITEHDLPIRLDLSGDNIRLRVRIDEAIGCIDKIGKVLFGPCNFSPRAGRWIGHGEQAARYMVSSEEKTTCV